MVDPRNGPLGDPARDVTPTSHHLLLSLASPVCGFFYVTDPSVLGRDSPVRLVAASPTAWHLVPLRGRGSSLNLLRQKS